MSAVLVFDSLKLGSVRAASLIAGLVLWVGLSADSLPTYTAIAPGLDYANPRILSEPWSINIVRLDRANPDYSFQSIHAQGAALGLETLSEQVKLLSPALGKPIAAVNGDFYQRERAYAGDPRGLQISGQELLSGPIGGVTFWVDATNQLNAANVTSRFEVVWPDGKAMSFDLNQERVANQAVLYTPAAGSSTHTRGGRELVLVPAGSNAASTLRIDESVSTKVREIREKGDTTLAPGTWVLSLDPTLAARASGVAVGDTLKISTATVPELRGASTAISGGPLLLRNGKRQTIKKPKSESYESSSMFERHPRTAIGWNRRYFFLVVVDGRQRELSVGMTLEELADYLRTLGCEEAMNLDGGGSATLWCDGKVRNHPCDGRERPIANALVIARKSQSIPGPAATNGVPIPRSQ